MPSTNDPPLRLIEIPTIRRGRLLITICPGKKGSGLAGRSHNRDLQTDLDTLVEADVKVVCSLLTREEMELLEVPDLGGAIQERGMIWLHFPMPDGGVPNCDLNEWMKRISVLDSMLERNFNVVVHCRGGCGRAGLAACSLLISHGASDLEALAAVRFARPCAVETEAQESFLWQVFCLVGRS